MSGPRTLLRLPGHLIWFPRTTHAIAMIETSIVAAFSYRITDFRLWTNPIMKVAAATDYWQANIEAYSGKAQSSRRDASLFTRFATSLALLQSAYHAKCSLHVTREVAMPPASKRRKVLGAATSSSAVPSTQRRIQSFGKISKAQVQPIGKVLLDKEKVLVDSDGKSALKLGSGAKRKSQWIESNLEKNEETINNSTKQVSLLVNGSGLDDAEHEPYQLPSPLSSQPVTPRKKASSKSVNRETPAKSANLRSKSLTSLSSAPSITIRQSTPACPVTSQEDGSDDEKSSRLPEELQDLINLHSCFLTALSLHYAHNGSMTPADLRNLGPSIGRAWRKRRVTVEDVQRTLALIENKSKSGVQDSNLLFLSDYGLGKLCVEIRDYQNVQKLQRRPVNEEDLNDLFIRNLEQRWKEYKNLQLENSSPAAFIASLPILPITACASLSKLAPLLSKGQLRLEDLKAGAIRAQQSSSYKISSKALTSPQNRPKPTTTRSTDLLSRIKAKQLHQSTLPLPPSSESQVRKSALQRLTEVAPVIESLAASSKIHANDDAVAEIFKMKTAHASFTMPTLVQHLQMSLRNPVGKEEAVRCVRLLAEVAPEWMVVRNVGRMIGVTVRGIGIGRAEMVKRVERLMGTL